MKILHIIFAILYALLAGWFIQLAGNKTDLWQIAYYAGAILNAGYCFWHLSKALEDE